MRIKQVDRKAVLSGDVVVYLKENQSFINDEWEVFSVSHIKANKFAIIEVNGKCYVSWPFDNGSITGLLYETRDSFDELVARYSKDAGGNALEKEE